ncbi:hypothetical protein P3W85_45170 [Cupriavidus basilensis]|uniref:Uncharacterized protein n=1 Tax=Cupriavidus basilensis TaxID=68895 RepID=A0ABT6B599_9BURK|nr:hypothetical protein [Cupriavidus basilensis]MDF3840067.1 hypothetical protein [Cupriavidus basilensis]
MMPRISLTDLVDVVSKAGSPKATKVRQIKNRQEYSPATDFYRPFREKLVALHESNSPKNTLLNICSGLTDIKKIKAYPDIVEGYRKWWGNKNLNWFQPPSVLYSHLGMDVSVNPELGLSINGEQHVIKLYLKDDEVNKAKMDLITALMEHCLRPKVTARTMVGVLDVRGAKLYTLGTSAAAQKAIIDAELAYIAALWPCV